MGYRAKLQLAFLTLGLAAITLTGWEASAGATAALRKATYDRIGSDISERIATLEKRIEAEMEQLRRKFAAMEQAQARSQSILGNLQQLANQLSGNSGRK